MGYYPDTWTDRKLEDLEERISTIYADAYAELQTKATAYFANFRERYKKEYAAYKAGKYTDAQFRLWYQSQVGRGKRWEALRDDMASRMTDSNKIAARYTNGTVPLIAAENYNYSAYEIEHSYDNKTFTLVDEDTIKLLMMESREILPQQAIDEIRDYAWNKQQFTNQLLLGILQGDDIGSIANRFQKVSEMNRKTAIRNARTAVTGAQNAGRQVSYERAEAMGIKMQKEWVATNDSRTRPSHRQMDGVRVDVDEKFPNGLMHPADSSGEPEEVFNCRCTMISVLPKINDKQRTGNTKESYLAWKKGKQEEGQVVTEEPKQRFNERIVAIRDSLNGQTPTLEQLQEVGKIFADEVHERWNGYNSEYDRAMEEWERVYDEAIKRWHQSGNSAYWDYVNTDEYKNAKAEKERVEKINGGYYGMQATRLSDVLSEVREVGINGIEKEVNTHLGGSRSPVKKYIESAYNGYPKEWVDMSMQRGKLTPKKVQRGYYSSYAREIAISGNDDNDRLECAIHELGHRFEDVNARILNSEREFYKKRTDGESLKWLGNGFAKSEKTRFDDFIDPYMGKDYGGSAFELVSMGFQLAYTNPKKLAKDPDMESWIYGVLSLL